MIHSHIAVPSSWDTDEEDDCNKDGTTRNRSNEDKVKKPNSNPEPQPPQELKLSDRYFLIPQVHLYSDGGIDLSADGRYILTCARVLVEPPSQKLAGKGDASQSLFENDETGTFCSSPQSPKEAHDALLPTATSSSYLKKANGNSQQNLFAESTRDGVHLQENLLSRTLWLESELEQDLELYDPNRRSRESAMLLGVFSPPAPSSSSSTRGRKYIFADPRRETAEKEYTGWVTEDHLCLIHLELVSPSHRPIPYTIGSGYPGCHVKPSISRSFVLNASLVKAVTSTKLSPTGRYALVGYGVRSNSIVEGHPQQDVACEVINLLDMETVTIMPDNEDEVNIAQFHPIPGRGVLYGTKKGKVRTFRGCDEKDDEDMMMEEQSNSTQFHPIPSMKFNCFVPRKKK